MDKNMFMIYLQAKREQTWNEKDSHLKKKKTHENQSAELPANIFGQKPVETITNKN